MKGQIVVANEKNFRTDGKTFAHNFTNTYVEDSELRKPSKEVAKAIETYTKREIDKVVGNKTESAYNASGAWIPKADTQYIRYTANGPTAEGAAPQQKIIKMHTAQKDPLAPAGFKNKRIPKGPGSPPKAVMHSPPRKLTVKDQADWKIPPCISNWKNVNGYTIPLHMRVSADGRALQNHTVNERFAQLTDSLGIAERQSRREIEERNKIQQGIAYQEYLKKEHEMREAAAKARVERTKLLEGESKGAEAGEKSPAEFEEPTEEDMADKKMRDELRYIRKREIERDRRIEMAGNKKAKAIRDSERDISEKVALGQAQPTISNEVMYDQRLFNQTSGLGEGFGHEDDYTVYDKPLFTDRTAASIYRNNKEVPEDDDGDDSKPKAGIDKVYSKEPHKGFQGAERGGPRSKPIAFERHDDDIFGLDSFMEPKKKQKTD